MRARSKLGPFPVLRLLPFLLALPTLVLAQSEPGIPVTDAVMNAKCASCHPIGFDGNMQRISWERTTPEGWEEALKRMIRSNRVMLTPAEARGILKYLSASHGLAPDEAKSIEYYPERRVHDESGMESDALMDTCAKCHAIARALSWHRSAADWKEFATAHSARYKFKLNEEAVTALAKLTPLQTPAWASWSANSTMPDLSGRWLISAHVQGRGTYCGEMNIKAGSTSGEYSTEVKLNSLKDGSTITRSGRELVYSGFQWRGKSKGTGSSAASDPYDLGSEARETMWISADGKTAEGRWFWGQYQEFGFDVKMQRPATEPSLLAVNISSLKTGTKGARIRLIGDKFPAQVKPADVSAGAGTTVRRVVSSSSSEVVAEVDVASGAVPGKRDVLLKSAKLPGALAIYDRVDYVKVTPESSMAGFGGQSFARGFQQFEAIGYQRGPDGKLHTGDDMELGPVDVTWSMEVFYETDPSKFSLVGNVSPAGFFTPAAESPGTNYDIWVIATAAHDTNKEGKPLVGKGYVVVTVPTYTFEGRKYVRELDRWIEDGRETR